MTVLDKPIGKQSVTLYLYAKLMPIQLLSSVTVSLCSIINTLIISGSLGAAGLSQMKVVDAVTNIISIFTLLLSSGAVLLIGRAVCKGEKDVCNEFFSVSLTVAVIFGVSVGLVCTFFAAPICTFFGADAEMLPDCCETLKGNIPFYFALPLCSVFLSLFQIRSALKTPIISSIISFILNISLNYLFLSVFGFRLFYSALAASIAQVVTFLFLFCRHRKTGFAKFSLKSVKKSSFGVLLSLGYTESGSGFWSAIKNSLMIKILAAVGGAQALSSFSIICSIDAVTFGLFSKAFQFVTLMIAGIFINEGDRLSLRRFFKTAIITAFGIAVVLSAVMFFSAYPSALLYHVEDVAAHVRAQHIYSFAFLFYMPYMVIVTLFAALDKRKTVNTLSFFTALILPLITMGTFGYLFGVVGFWLGLAAGDMLSLTVTLLYTVFHNRHIPRSLDELLCLDENFGVRREDTFSLAIRSIDDAANASERIIAFCKERQIDPRTAFLSGLCLEEIAVNIVTHGFRHKNKKGLAELTVINHPDRVLLIVRDNCKQFDPMLKLASYDENDKTKGIGIRIVTRSADVAYKNMYGLNIITLTLAKPNTLNK